MYDLESEQHKELFKLAAHPKPGEPDSLAFQIAQLEWSLDQDRQQLARLKNLQREYCILHGHSWEMPFNESPICEYCGADARDQEVPEEV